MLFKFVVSMRGARHEARESITAQDVADLAEHTLPVYTVLVPVYREANVVADLLANLGGLDYPAQRLEILLLMGEDDTETLEAVRAAAPPQTIRFIVVPDGLPKTKPKACNVGLFFARGEYVVIYDAEDRPEPDQLKRAVIAFQRADPPLNPLYWLLHAAAAYKALWQLLTRPHYWEKTAHGLSHLVHHAPAPSDGAA